jgi:ADP-heptose:LPS heptosyltransferase
MLTLMISMDSANGHLAANCEVPVLTVWGMTHPFCGFCTF